MLRELQPCRNAARCRRTHNDLPCGPVHSRTHPQSGNGTRCERVHTSHGVQCERRPAGHRKAQWQGGSVAGAESELGSHLLGGSIAAAAPCFPGRRDGPTDRKSTRLNSSHPSISYAVFCLKKKKKNKHSKHTAKTVLDRTSNVR